MSRRIVLTRRRLLTATGLGLVAAPVVLRRFGRSSRRTPVFLSASDDREGRHHITGFDLEAGPRFSIPVDQRCHEAVRDPAEERRAIVVARRPGTAVYDVDLAYGRLARVVTSPAGRHVYGHAEFSADGALLYVTENDFEHGRGVIGVYDGRDLVRVGEIPSHGIGPHEIRLLSDGATLVVANGGIRTHPAHGRAKLNLDTMAPSLVYVDAGSGLLLGEYRLADPHAGLRHLDVTACDVVAVAMQYEGEPTADHPLVALHHGEDALRLVRCDPNTAAGLRGYAASVCFDADGRRVGITCPYGNRAAFFDVESGECARVLSIRDPGGLTRTADGHLLVTTGFGEIHRFDVDTLEPTPGSPVVVDDVRWDNHLTRCGSIAA